VIETSVHSYPDTRALALQWHQHYPDLDGLFWISRQDDQSQACMLFGDRVDSQELAITQAARPLLESPQLNQLVQLAKQLGISKARAFASAIVGF
jgi:hypothetical protein